MDKQIDILLPILIVGFLIFLIKIIGYLISKVLKIKTSEQRKEENRKKFFEIYPIDSDEIPLEHLSRGDRITFSGGETYVYHQFCMERHSLWQNQKEFLFSNASLTSNAICLENKNGIKWIKSN